MTGFVYSPHVPLALNFPASTVAEIQCNSSVVLANIIVCIAQSYTRVSMLRLLVAEPTRMVNSANEEPDTCKVNSDKVTMESENACV